MGRQEDRACRERLRLDRRPLGTPFGAKGRWL